jgi:hypothetical protein
MHATRALRPVTMQAATCLGGLSSRSVIGTLSRRLSSTCPDCAGNRSIVDEWTAVG